jgi:hypothetical protein
MNEVGITYLYDALRAQSLSVFGDNSTLVGSLRAIYYRYFIHIAFISHDAAQHIT